GRIIVGNSLSWITSDDPALLARAVAVKPAKLTAVSANLAVSELSKEKVLGALRAKGLAPGELSEEKPVAEPSPGYVRQDVLRARPLPGENDITALARRLLDDAAWETADIHSEPDLVLFEMMTGGAS
ncbi:MAG TPA: hypothetical protein VE569_12775, partial [Acidimicrobiia bacterium]|nr:hypothetical protein [Acidimicrobiia bacterium]